MFPAASGSVIVNWAMGIAASVAVTKWLDVRKGGGFFRRGGNRSPWILQPTHPEDVGQHGISIYTVVTWVILYVAVAMSLYLLFDYLNKAFQADPPVPKGILYSTVGWLALGIATIIVRLNTESHTDIHTQMPHFPWFPGLFYNNPNPATAVLVGAVIMILIWKCLDLVGLCLFILVAFMLIQ